MATDRLDAAASELSSSGQAALDAEVSTWDAAVRAGSSLLADLCRDVGSSSEATEAAFSGVDGYDDAGDRGLKREGDRMADRVRVLLADLALGDDDRNVAEVDDLGGGAKASTLRASTRPVRLAQRGPLTPALPRGSVIVTGAFARDLVAFVDRLRAGYDSLAGVCGRAKAARVRLARELTQLRVLQDRGVLVDLSSPAAGNALVAQERPLQSRVFARDSGSIGGSVDAASVRSAPFADTRGSRRLHAPSFGVAGHAQQPDSSLTSTDLHPSTLTGGSASGDRSLTGAASMSESGFRQLIRATASIADPAAEVSSFPGCLSCAHCHQSLICNPSRFDSRLRDRPLLLLFPRAFHPRKRFARGLWPRLPRPLRPHRSLRYPPLLPLLCICKTKTMRRGGPFPRLTLTRRPRLPLHRTACIITCMRLLLP